MLKPFLFTLMGALGTHAVLAAPLDGPPAPAVEARQSPDDTWWTGPLLATSAKTPPKGYFLVEPYLYDSIVDTGAGTRHEITSLVSILYTFTDRLSVTLTPRVGYEIGEDGQESRSIAFGDLTARVMYRLMKFETGRRRPFLSAAIAETLPTGKYDRLNASDPHLGKGAYTTTFSLFSRFYAWMPNGRLLQTRLNFSYSISDNVAIRDVSVYRTPAGFEGHAAPGDSFITTIAWEYSATRQWVPALDISYQHDAHTPVFARETGDLRLNLSSRQFWSFAPAIEYNWSGRGGVIAGVKITPEQSGIRASVTPMIAVNLVL